MKILVTGGLGALGRPLVGQLRERGHDVWLCDLMHSSDSQYVRCDVGESRQVERLIDQVKPDFVYHLAAEFGRWNGEDYYEKVWKTNGMGMKNMLRAQERSGFKMVFTSSSEVYGDWAGLMTEEVMMEQPIRQLNDYAISKWVNEMQIMNSQDRFKTETVRVRLFNTYGPGEHYSAYRSVVCAFIYRALHNIPYTVYLNHHRSSSYIDDTIRTLSNISDPGRFKSGQVYNISGDEYHDIKILSDMILAGVGRDDALVSYVEVEEHNTLNKSADNSKAKKDLDHQPTVTLEDGIKRTIEWQRQIYNVKQA